MQGYLLDGMWSRPHRYMIVRSLLGFILKRWYLCTAMALAGLVLEFGWLPLVLMGGRAGGVAAALIAFSFHLGIDVLQGLDFKPFWCPVFWAFLPDAQALWMGLPEGPESTWYAILAQGFDEEPFRFCLSAGYVLLQIIVAVRFLDCKEGKECLPFSCCPMFMVPRNIFDNELRGGVLTDLDFRGGGHIDFAYNFYPWHEDLPMTEDDLQKIPGRVLFWMSTTHVDPLIARMIQEEHLGKEILIKANFEVSLELRAKILDYVRAMEEAQPSDWANPDKVGEIVDQLAECRTLFEAHPFCPPPVCQLKEIRNEKKNPVLNEVQGLMAWLSSYAPSEEHPHVAY